MNWLRKSFDELEAFYWETTASTMDCDRMDPMRDVPTYAWLTERDWSGIVYTFREKHDLAPREFFVKVVGLDNDKADEGCDWGVDDDRTVEAFESYLGVLESQHSLADSTLPTRRTHLARLTQIYRDRHGSTGLLSWLDDRDAEPDEIDRCLTVLDKFGAELATDGTKLKYLQTVRSLYEYLVDFRHARYNPAEDATKQSHRKQSQPDSRTMTANQVSDVYTVADDLGDRLLVLRLAGWGLRPNELASLRASQLILSGDDSRTVFGERRNRPETVALLYGVDAVAAHIDALAADDDWNGALFPSSRAVSGHIARETANRRFKRLADEAGVAVDGEVPTMKLYRHFWYTTYREVAGEMLAQLRGVTVGQESKNAGIVMSNYLSEERRRSLHRQAICKTLADVFESAGESTTVETQMP